MQNNWLTMQLAQKFRQLTWLHVIVRNAISVLVLYSWDSRTAQDCMNLWKYSTCNKVLWMTMTTLTNVSLICVAVAIPVIASPSHSGDEVDICQPYPRPPLFSSVAMVASSSKLSWNKLYGVTAAPVRTPGKTPIAMSTGLHITQPAAASFL